MLNDTQMSKAKIKTTATEYHLGISMPNAIVTGINNVSIAMMKPVNNKNIVIQVVSWSRMNGSRRARNFTRFSFSTNPASEACVLISSNRFRCREPGTYDQQLSRPREIGVLRMDRTVVRCAFALTLRACTFSSSS